MSYALQIEPLIFSHVVVSAFVDTFMLCSDEYGSKMS